MTTPAERYRKYAADCLAFLQKSRVTADRTQLLAMADSWKQLAEDAERAAVQQAVQATKSGDLKVSESTHHVVKADDPRDN
jgi:hypothetical protein